MSKKNAKIDILNQLTMRHLFLRSVNKRLLAGLLLLSFFLVGIMLGYSTGIKEGGNRMALAPINAPHRDVRVLGVQQAAVVKVDFVDLEVKKTIQFPIAELGSCANSSDCQAWCEQEQNIPSCQAWANQQ